MRKLKIPIIATIGKYAWEQSGGPRSRSASTAGTLHAKSCQGELGHGEHSPFLCGSLALYQILNLMNLVWANV